MKIYFGEVAQEFLDHSDDYFFNNGKAYYFLMEADDDMVTITDSIGRMVPFDRSQVDELAGALEGVQVLYDALDDAEELVAERVNSYFQQ